MSKLSWRLFTIVVEIVRSRKIRTQFLVLLKDGFGLRKAIQGLLQIFHRFDRLVILARQFIAMESQLLQDSLDKTEFHTVINGRRLPQLSPLHKASFSTRLAAFLPTLSDKGFVWIDANGVPIVVHR